MFDLAATVARLRTAGSDSRAVEAKSAAGGLPRSLGPTLSAFANLPGGGVILLGLDESKGFAVVRIKDRPVVAAGLVSLARQGLDPPVNVDIDEALFEGETLLVATVAELPPSAKPCRLLSNRKAYLRFGDGDYELSAVEEEGFIIGRTRPRFDEQEVPEAQRDDLDADLVDGFVSTTRADDARLRRFDTQDLLVKTGVLTRRGVPTLAGLAALGQYPQQFLPAFSIRAALVPPGPAHGAVRVLDEATFNGPVGFMLDEAVRWVRRNSRNEIVENRLTGHVRNRTIPPELAVRELISNAIVHRDFAPWSSGRAIELRMSNEHFRLTNPGGLYGVSISSLGSLDITSARNRLLVDICKRIRTEDGRVVEALATGIPTVIDELAAAELPPPRFFDDALSFTATITTQRAQLTQPSGVARPQGKSATPAQQAVLAVLADGPSDLDSISSTLAVAKASVSKRLQALVHQGRVVAQGGRGIRTIYRIAP